MLVTKYVVTSTESNILPSDIAMKIYGSKYKVLVKETCLGVIIKGEEEVIEALITEIRPLTPLASSSKTGAFRRAIPGAAGVAEVGERGLVFI